MQLIIYSTKRILKAVNISSFHGQLQMRCIVLVNSGYFAVDQLLQLQLIDKNYLGSW